MNSDVFLRHMKELTKNMIENTRQINERDRWRSDYGYEDDLEHDMGMNLVITIFMIPTNFLTHAINISKPS